MFDYTAFIEELKPLIATGKSLHLNMDETASTAKYNLFRQWSKDVIRLITRIQEQGYKPWCGIKNRRFTNGSRPLTRESIDQFNIAIEDTLHELEKIVSDFETHPDSYTHQLMNEIGGVNIPVIGAAYRDTTKKMFGASANVKLYEPELAPKAVDVVSFSEVTPLKAPEVIPLKVPEKLTLSWVWHNGTLTFWGAVASIGLAVFVLGLKIGSSKLYADMNTPQAPTTTQTTTK